MTLPANAEPTLSTSRAIAGSFDLGRLTLHFTADLDADGDVMRCDILRYEHPHGDLIAFECHMAAIETIPLGQGWADVLAEQIKHNKAKIA